MSKFEQISIHPGFMKHNGGLFFKVISETESQFKTTVNENHLNRAGITHGGYIASIIDAGIGTGVHRTTSKNIFVTISLDPINFISKEIVTNILLLVVLWTPVPIPASIIDAIYPPCVIPALFK